MFFFFHNRFLSLLSAVFLSSFARSFVRSFFPFFLSFPPFASVPVLFLSFFL